MAQACKICKHTDRQAIDAVLVEGWPSLRVIGSQYGVSKDSPLRHYRAHIPDDSQGDEEPVARQLAEVVEQKKEPIDLNNQSKSNGGAEPRQSKPGAVGSVLKQGKTTEPEKVDNVLKSGKNVEPEDAEARYRAFIEHWSDRIGVWLSELDGEGDLVEEGISRGDLKIIGNICIRTLQLRDRLCETD